MPNPIPSQAMGIPVQSASSVPVVPRQAIPNGMDFRNRMRSQLQSSLANRQPGFKNFFQILQERRAAQRAAPAAVPAMKSGGPVEKLKKLKKPIKRKSLKKADRVRKPAYAEGGAVERFLAKYPNYKPGE